MSAAHDVSLRQRPPPAPPEPTQQLNARVKARWMEYVRGEAVGDRTQADVVEDALELDKVLAEKLAPHLKKLQAYAEESRLSLKDDLPEIVSRLAIAGLHCPKKP